MQYIAIKEEIKNGKTYYLINAIPLKNSNKSVVQRIPHPLGTDVLSFETLEDAKDAISRAGFSYVLPDGKKGSSHVVKRSVKTNQADFEHVVYDAIKDKVNSSNVTVSAAAILAISEFPNEKTFDILFNMLGEDNDVVRKNAISGICRYGNLLIPRIIDSLKSQNWVERNSAITCISNLCENANIASEEFILPLVESCNDNNSIVQSNALITIAKVYQAYMKKKKI
jgi:HEAT repeat protein